MPAIAANQSCLPIATSLSRVSNSQQRHTEKATSKLQTQNPESDSGVPSISMRRNQALQHELELMRRFRTQSRHHLRFVRFGLLQQGLHFAPTSGREAHQALPFVVCGVATLDPPGVLHAAYLLDRVTGA
jgi:hypothetical protein